ncbi:MAG TPA: MMPL family transporter [Solirubrobacteraceae bacterium]|nr:MMPL family transporter [Solirubrobacteraceae bacterium]
MGAIAVVVGSGTPSRLSSSGIEFYSHGTQSYRTTRLLEIAEGPSAFPNLEIIFPRERKYEQIVLKQAQNVATLVPHGFGSRNGKAVAVIGHLNSRGNAGAAAARLSEDFRSFKGITVGGSALIHQQFVEQIRRDLTKAEIIVAPLLLLLAFFLFRSAASAMLPILTGSIALSVALALLGAINALAPISILSLDLVVGLSVGLSLDYSLLLVSRYREELARGLDRAGATSATMSTAGRTVAISSITVTAAFAAPLVFPIGFLRSLAVGGMLAAIAAGAVSLLVLPAIFSLAGHRVNALAPRRLQRSARREAAQVERGFWYRLARYVMAHPAAIAVVSAGALLAMGAPALGMRLTGLDGITLLPPDTSVHRFDERIRNEFRQPLLGEVVVAVRGNERHVSMILSTYVEKLPDVADAEISDVKGKLWVLSVRELTTPFSDASQRLVDSIRASPYGLTVTGSTADYMDTAASLRSRLPIALTILFATTLVCLFIATDSIILPIKAVVMNVLSFAAAIGLLVLVFQDGRFEGLLAYRGQGALNLVQPILLGAGIFGISTDYGVFMLTRIKEGMDSGLPNNEAVAVGLERTGRIISAAALLFCVAVGSLVLARIGFVKEAAFGLVAAVAIDVTIVRAFLVPSLMMLLGKWNWWRPRGFRRTRLARIVD